MWSMLSDKDTQGHGVAGRGRKDELEAAWWQEHAELALGPAAAGHAPSGGSPTKAGPGGAEGNMTRKVASNVNAPPQTNGASSLCA